MQLRLCIWRTQNAVQRNACPDITALEFRIIQEAIAALNMSFRNVYALFFQPVYHFIKSCNLLSGEQDILLVLTVRHAQMCVNSIDDKIFHCKHPRELLYFFSSITLHRHPKSQTVHSCV